MEILSSLESVTSEPLSWWNLELTKDEIRIASFWGRWSQWIASFFTDQLKRDLRQTVHTILSKDRLPNPALDLAVEKVARLVHQKQSWLFEAAHLTDPSRVEVKNLAPLPSSIQPYKEGERYYNYPGEKIWHQFFTTLYLLFPGALSTPSDEDLKAWNREDWHPCARSIGPQITWLGHAGILFQGAGINLILDPTFGFVGPCFRRHTPPPIPFSKLPLIDAIGISHNHGDHFDQESLKKWAAYNPFAFVPQGLDVWFDRNGYEKKMGAGWWQRCEVTREGRKITLTAIPAQHGSQLTLTDLNKTLWMGIMIEVEDTRIYFAGDSGFNEAIFREIKNQFGEIDLALLPIAPEGEKEVHVDYKEALDAFAILGAKQMIPIHYGAYRTGVEKIEEPLRLLQEEAEKRGIIDQILFPKLGQTLAVAHVEEKKAVS